MAKIIRIIVNGVRGIGMVDGVYSIYRTNRPYNTPIILDSEQAAEADKEALESDWSRIGLDLAHAYDCCHEFVSRSTSAARRAREV